MADDSLAAPRVSILVPARNEERNIADCLHSLLQQGEPIEIIVADDSSEDRTAEIVRQLCRENPSLKLIPAPPLPEGWLGKNHALHVAAQHAQGEWLLFTDADPRHEPGKLFALMEWAGKAGLDLVSLSPQQEVCTWWERAVIPQVYRQLAQLYPYARVNDPDDALAAANGQFILIQREAYRALGGHETVRECVLEDVELARRAKAAGYRLWFGPGEGIVRTRMYRRFAEMWQGWTKNLFLLYHRDSGAVRRAAAKLALRYVLPIPAGLLFLLSGATAAGLGGVLWAYAAAEHWAYWRSLKGEGRAATMIGLVPGALLLALLLLNSEWHYSRQKGILWKGRHYRAAG